MTILDRIASGGTDPVGAFHQGQDIRSTIFNQQLQQQQLETNKLVPQLQQQQLETGANQNKLVVQKLLQGADANALQNSAVTLAMALGMPDEDQKTFLARENSKLPEGSKYRRLMESMSATPDRVKRNARIIKMLDVFKSAGAMGGKTGGKTTGQIQQEIDIKERKIGLGEKTLEFEKTKGEKISPLKRMLEERQELLDSGLTDEDAEVQAYNSKLLGTDANVADLSQGDIDTIAGVYALTGKMPPVGRGKSATVLRSKILKSAAQQLQGGEEGAPERSPVDAALYMVGQGSDTKAIQGSLNFLDKQLSSMGSFVKNITSQIDEVSELAQDLDTYDTRLLNVPLRVLRGRIKGSALQAKYDLYLSEIESEIGKLSSGSSASVAELSTGAREKWEKIHDKALSTSDMLDLLAETKKAADFRLTSVQDQLDATRQRMRRGRDLPDSPGVPDNDPLGIR